MILKISNWIFLIYIAALPVVRPFTLSLGGFRLQIWDFLFLALLIFFTVALLRRQISFDRHNIIIFIALYGLSLSLSALFSDNPSRSVIKLFAEFYLFGLAYIAYVLARREGFMERLVWFWLAGTSIALVGSLLGFVLFYAGYKTPETNFFLSHFGSLPGGNYPRIHSFFANANMYCNYLNVSLMATVGAMRAGLLSRAFGRFFVIAIWIAALFTFSPGIGGLAISSALWLLFVVPGDGRRKVFRKLAAVPLIAVSVLFLGAAMISPDTPNSPLDYRIPGTNIVVEPSVRVLVWQNVMENTASNPWFGSGVGLDPARIAYTTLAGDRQILLDAHNLWLSVFGQAGILGLIAVTALTGYLLTLSIGYLKVSPNNGSWNQAFACAVIGALFFQGITGSFEDARHLWVLIGLFCAAKVFNGSGSGSASQAP